MIMWGVVMWVAELCWRYMKTWVLQECWESLVISNDALQKVLGCAWYTCPGHDHGLDMTWLNLTQLQHSCLFLWSQLDRINVPVESNVCSPLAGQGGAGFMSPSRGRPKKANFSVCVFCQTVKQLPCSFYRLVSSDSRTGNCAMCTCIVLKCLKVFDLQVYMFYYKLPWSSTLHQMHHA